MKSFLLFILLLLFVQNTKSTIQDVFKVSTNRNVTKDNFMSQIVLAMGPDAVKQYFLGNYTQSSIYRLNITTLATNILQTLKNDNSSECEEDIFSFLYAFIRLEYWAIQMYDAQGKIRSGLTDGDLLWPGSYAVCKQIFQQPPYLEKYPEPFRGKYCWSEIEFASGWLPKIPGADDLVIPPLRWAFCAPSSCSSDEVFDFMHRLTEFEWMIKLFNVTDVSCLPEQPDFWKDNKAVLAFVILVLFGTIALVATTFDLYLKLTKLILSESNNTIENSPPSDGNVVLATRHNNNYKNQENNTVTTTFSEVAIPAEVDGHISEEQKPIPPDDEGLAKKAIFAFSLHRNLYKLLELKKSKSTIECVNGIKVLTLLWVIMSKTYIGAALSSDNLLTVVNIMQSIVFEIVAGSALAADTFFLISGLLVSYVYFTHHEENNGKTSWIKFYLYRYLRLTPFYILFIIVIDNSLVNYFTVGPFWPTNGFEGNNCNNNWWWNVLYINNFTPSKEMCLEQSWYLATDMQFYIFSPLILILLSRYFPIGLIVSGVFILTSWLTSGLISSHYNLQADLNVLKFIPKTDPYYEVLDQFYYKPYLHIAPYVIGLLFGWFLHRTKLKLRLEIWMVCLGWTLSTLAGICVIFGLYNANDNISLQIASLYHALSRTLWSFILCWIIFACSNGYGGIVNIILSFPIMQPLSRLTYCAFLMHALAIEVAFDRANIPVHFSHIFSLYFTFANIFIIYVFSIPLSLLFEMPFKELLKLSPKSSASLK